MELGGNQAIFIGFKLDSGLRRQIDALTGPDRRYVSDENSTFLSSACEVHLVLRSFRVEIDRTHHVEAASAQRRDERLPDVGVCVDREPGHYWPRESAQALSAESSPSISSRLS